MVKHKKLGMAVVGACALCGASAAHAFNVRAGDWDLSVAGNVNTFYNYSRCDSNEVAVVGGLTCTQNPGATTGVSSVTSGLLPSAIVFSAKTTQEGFDLGVTFGFYPDINISAVPGSNGNINMRQNFMTFGDKEMGTIKMGRDLGIYGSDAIISDFTILGVGGGVGSNTPTNTTLGRIGIGYIYADWIPQITYITPSFDGFQVSAGVFQPLVMQSNPVAGVITTTVSGHSVPMFQAKGTYDFNAGDVKGRFWAGGLAQRSTGTNGGTDLSNSRGVTAYAGDVGAKAALAGFEAVVYYYQTRGVGSTLYFLNGIDSSGNKRNSNGGYAQLQYTGFGKFKPGISWGISRLNDSGQEVNPTLLQDNRSYVNQLQYSLTKALSLVAEHSYIQSKNQLGQELSQHSWNLGAILFF